MPALPRFAGLLTSLLLAVAPGASAEGGAGLAEFRARHGAAWTLQTDARSGRPRRLSGGALDLLASAGASSDRAALVAGAESFLTDWADLLGVDAAALRPTADGGPTGAGFAALHFDFAPGGVRVEGARVTLVVAEGRLLAAHVVGSAPVPESPTPRVLAVEALETALAALQLARPDARLSAAPELVFRPRPGGHDLSWRIELLDPAGRRHRAFVHAGDGRLLSLTDETVQACDPPAPGGGARRVLGGVRSESATEPERLELLGFATVGDSTAGADGFFDPPTLPGPGRLFGPVVQLQCSDCSNPVQPQGAPGATGDVDFGDGGADEVGNGSATPADRSSFFHVTAIGSQVRRWLDLPFLDAPLAAATNVVGGCNAQWNGSWLSFERSSARCSNSGEIRDVIAHEFGHALDEHDGQPPAGLSVDAATGEAIGDVVAMLRSRDACIGESFFLGAADFPSDGCSGVRDLDELATGHRRGAPATLSTGNVAALCPPSGFYRGPLGREGHCEGEILGQAFWHLARNLATATAYADGSPLSGPALGDEDAWQVAESLFYRALPLIASYAPSDLQSIGLSAYEAFLLADDEGDGIANGTPHSWAIHEAFAHHGIAEPGPAPPDGTRCLPPAAPILVATTVADAATGLPAVRLEWNDTGAARYLVLRGDAGDEALLPIAEVVSPAARMVDDRGILPGRLYRYAVVAEDLGGCASTAANTVPGSAGAFLRAADLRLDDSLGGDGDGLLEPGETADLELDVENLGSSPATALMVELASPHPALVVLDPGPLAYGDVAAGATAAAPAAFRIRADAGVPLSVLLNFTGEALEGCLRADREVAIVQPLLSLGGQRIDDSAASGDLVWDPGETVDAYFELENAGTANAAVVTGVLAFRGAPPGGVTLVRTNASWPAIDAGLREETTAPGFALAADPATEPGSVVALRLDLEIDGLPHASFDVELLVGGFPPGLLDWSTSTRDIPPLSTGQAVNLPLLLQTNDDDGDGLITECDFPDVVFEVWNIGSGDEIVILSGADGSWIRSFPIAPCRGGWSIFQALAGADVDGDGDLEILTEDGSGFACAFETDGTLLWKGVDRVLDADFRPFWGRAAPQVWDLDHDGTAEIVIGLSVTEGADGSVDWADLAPRGSGRSLVGDLDLDGDFEIISNRGEVRGSDGTDLGRLFPGFWSMGGLINMDADPNPEVVYVAWNDQPTPTVQAREHDGTAIWEWTPPDMRDLRCPPCFGDFDGDGKAETALPLGPELVMIDDDGTTAWSLPVADGSGAAGCSVFDFDLDGRPEILHHDENDLRVIDGATGAVLWTTPNRSQTQGEFPLVGDVDGDLSAEIVVYQDLGGNSSLMKAFGNPRWPPARGTWNQEEYSVTHGLDSGAVVTHPAPRWLAGNDFRGQAHGCPCQGPVIDVSVEDPVCDGFSACFQIGVSGGLAPRVHEWDFGDGSPPAFGDTLCHEFPGPGDYLVLVDVRDAVGCPAQTSFAVKIPEPLSVSLSGAADCDGVADCFDSLVTGGSPPFEYAWSFDDEPSVVGSARECLDFPGPGWSASVFVRDARGCLAEARVGGGLGGTPANVGPFLFATAHGDPHAAIVEGDFNWSRDAGLPRPPGESYVLRRATSPDSLGIIPGTDGWALTTWTDATPAAPLLPQVQFLKVFAASACGQESDD